ncbi:MAG: nucleotidyltransferase [Ruminococcaceae bacterium]|nr:nucleotidyltransferase [Oscillospiraceae bacterium]
MDTKSSALIVMAAGMGSRFGGLKQMEPLGPHGEVILDYSVYDAMEAGFDKIVFVIKKAIEKDFRELVGKKFESKVDVSYTFQELDDLPKGFTLPEGRVKPWGTGHAVLTAKDIVKTPFAIVNADDYYGKSAYKLIHDYLLEKNEMCMAGYLLGNTISDNGTVARGVCKMSDGYLDEIIETTAIDKNSGIPLDTLVSMNMWGLLPDFFAKLEEGFVDFLKTNTDPLKGEFFIPKFIDHLIHNEGAKVKVLPANEKWYGVTYKEDSDLVKAAFKKFDEDGLYPGLK